MVTWTADPACPAGPRRRPLAELQLHGRALTARDRRAALPEHLRFFFCFLAERPLALPEPNSLIATWHGFRRRGGVDRHLARPALEPELAVTERRPQIGVRGELGRYRRAARKRQRGGGGHLTTGSARSLEHRQAQIELRNRDVPLAVRGAPISAEHRCRASRAAAARAWRRARARRGDRSGGAGRPAAPYRPRAGRADERPGSRCRRVPRRAAWPPSPSSPSAS